MDVVDLPDHLHDAAVRLWHEAGLTRPWNDPVADLARALEGPSSTVLAALDTDRLVGTVMLGHDGHRGWVYYLAVDRAARRQGVGSALVRAAEQWLVDRRIVKLQLMVRVDNDVAVGFYRALGYDVVDVTVLGRRLDANDS
ncbi:MAG: GNAT family acetyltransferase [Actinomycetes bacterium]